MAPSIDAQLLSGLRTRRGLVKSKKGNAGGLLLTAHSVLPALTDLPILEHHQRINIFPGSWPEWPWREEEKLLLSDSVDQKPTSQPAQSE